MSAALPPSTMLMVAGCTALGVGWEKGRIALPLIGLALPFGSFYLFDF